MPSRNGLPRGDSAATWESSQPRRISLPITSSTPQISMAVPITVRRIAAFQRCATA